MAVLVRHLPTLRVSGDGGGVNQWVRVSRLNGVGRLYARGSSGGQVADILVDS